MDNEVSDFTSPAKKNKRGKWVSSQQKEMIVNHYKSKVQANPKITIREARTIISKELGIGEKTISNTLKEYRETKTVSSPNKERIHKNVISKTDDFDKYAIRRKIHNLWINRELPTLDKILSVVNEDESLPSFSRATLHRLLKSMDFVYTKRGRNSALLDSNELILWRRRYLRNIKKYREEGRPIYYLDETWVNAGDVNTKVWVDKTVQSSQHAFSQGLSTGPVNPSGKGKRLIVVHIGSEDGFVPGGLLSFESKKNTSDYHDEMNGQSFRDWLLCVLPKLKDNAVIVMDNAPYHSVKLEKCPTTNWKKANIIEWLQSKGEVIDSTMIIPELLDIVKQLKPLYDKYEIDELVSQHNKTVLRLPPYHCELNPIEMAWSVIKNHVKSNNKTFKLKDVQKLLIEGVNKVTEEMWRNFISHTENEEDKFWNIDMIVDELMAERQDLVMTIGPER
ncbi:uncharacterized protein LOC103307901 [Acyrthosiphon pisum]|uniref:Tc1-like transposase DDE domain-containing protein n=1 Tax=Acyrthosiphon pisum TaxID=7029 RepID=A0A8R1X0E9_ACYPI|nr:uncharacterized protein LOC103307901 [Acyrthosiphon pisum]|eukprot:XP_008178574.1 PREDICTED: uncharacterized protein LOC103307901 [Acyrthosiphon pisum]